MKTIPERKEVIFKRCSEVIEQHDIGEELVISAVESGGYDPREASLLFPGGINEFILELSAYHDSCLKLDPTIKSTTAKIHSLLWQRVTMPNISQQALKKLLRYLSHPVHFPLASKLSSNSADVMWKLAGDTSTDMNYYSKRALLMTVYVRAVRYCCYDTSDGFAKTNQKIADLLANVLKLASVKKILTAPKRFINMVRERI